LIRKFKVKIKILLIVDIPLLPSKGELSANNPFKGGI